MHSNGTNRNQFVPLQVVVSHAAFSSDSCVLATVDVREPEEGIGSGLCLKFWENEAGNTSYRVNTRVDEPHR
jgi:NET1-associated nuclear protein 1 (U3 small nucleolar RNA-associated protein 17)